MEWLSQIMALISCRFPRTDIGTPRTRCQAKQAFVLAVQFADNRINKVDFQPKEDEVYKVNLAPAITKKWESSLFYFRIQYITGSRK